MPRYLTRSISQKATIFLAVSISLSALYLIYNFTNQTDPNFTEIEELSLGPIRSTEESRNEPISEKDLKSPLSDEDESKLESLGISEAQADVIALTLNMNNRYNIGGGDWLRDFNNALSTYPGSNGDSAYMHYRLLKSCDSPLSNRQNAVSGLEEGSWSRERFDQTLKVIGDTTDQCDLLIDAIKEGRIPIGEKSNAPLNDYEWREWLETLLSDAADSGNPSAILISEWEYYDFSEENYRETAENLELAVQTGDPTAMRYAADFYESFHHPDGWDTNYIESLKWLYLACAHGSNCNSKLGIEQFQSTLDPHQVKYIEDFEISFNKTRRENDPFGFAQGRLPAYLYEVGKN